MAERMNPWMTAVGGVVVGVLIGAVATSVANNSREARIRTALDTQTAQRIEAQSRADQAEKDLAAATARLRQRAATTPQTTPSTEPTPAATEAGTPATGSQSVKQFTFVKSVTLGAAPSLTADYAQMLNGKAAADAATAHGDESPPPNDYYIVNDNKKLRTLQVKPGITVKLMSKPDGTIAMEPCGVSLAKWAGYYAAPTTTNRVILEAPYWITLRDGVVIAIEEQYLP